MIKRRFYRVDHVDRDGTSSDSLSSSDSDIEAHNSEDSDTELQLQSEQKPDSDVEAEDDDDIHRPSLKPQFPSSSSSGYESEDSSAHEIDVDSVGLLMNNDDDNDSETGRNGKQLNDSPFLRKESGTIVEKLAKDCPVADGAPSCILKCKSVFKCRLCPKIVCLNEDSLKAHLKSKRHARSEKLLNGGRLKRVLNSDGEEVAISDDDGETHAERHARIVAFAESAAKKKSKGRQRQRQRLKKMKNSSSLHDSEQQKDNRAKRRRKNEA